jgi:hypothetical protein
MSKTFQTAKNRLNFPNHVKNFPNHKKIQQKISNPQKIQQKKPTLQITDTQPSQSSSSNVSRAYFVSSRDGIVSKEKRRIPLLYSACDCVL